METPYEDIADSVNIWVETLSGLRRQLIEQGFSEEAAEAICIASAHKQ